MRYEFTNPRALRYPFSDESLIGNLRVIAVLDSSSYVKRLVKAIAHDEILTDIMKPDQSIEKHMRVLRPDVFIINIDEFDHARFTDITVRMRNDILRMPFLIMISKQRSEEIDELIAVYNGVYHITSPFNPIEEGKTVQKFLLTKIISPELYRDNIRKCVVLTLRAMKCNPHSSGFSYLIDAVCYVMEKPYFRFNYSRDIYPRIARRYITGVQTVESSIRATVTAAIEKMDEQEISDSFVGYEFEEGQIPSVAEFIQAAAYITSRPCKQILSYLNDDPFIKRRDINANH